MGVVDWELILGIDGFSGDVLILSVNFVPISDFMPMSRGKLAFAHHTLNKTMLSTHRDGSWYRAFTGLKREIVEWMVS